MPIFASNFASNSLSGSVRIVNGFANITLATIPYALEGDKSFVIKVRKDSTTGEVLSSTPTLTFRENGSFVSLSANTSSINEGDLVAFTLVTANVTNGANLFYSIFPATANVTADDFVANTGSFTITNNAATFTVKANVDLSLVNETGENFRVQIRSANTSGNIIYVTSNIAIQDTSNAYNVLTFAPTLGSFSVLESSNIVFTFSATNVPFGTTIYYDTTGNATVTANTGSFVLNSLSNTFTLVGGTVAVGQINAFTVNLRTGSNAGPIFATSNTIYVLDSALASMNATGGEYAYTVYDPVTAIGYRVHKFLSSNNFTITRAGSSPTYANIEILMVAGGGSGGITQYPGTPPGGIEGGGAGGLLYYGTKTTKTANGPLLTTNITSTYAVVVGAGGTTGNAGSNTAFLVNSNVIYRAIGGGGGSYGKNGGSGGGAGGTGITGQGNSGGGSSQPFAGAGGGGAGAAGSSGSVRPWPSYPAFPQGVAGNGGNGLGYDIEGIQFVAGSPAGIPSTTYYAGGGAGGTASGASAGSLGATGGTGGGGDTATAGAPGTGGGGGGGYSAQGGGGVVIISYPYIPLPEYVSLQSNTSFSSIIEGDEIYFTLNNNFVANNTLLYYSTVGNVNTTNFIGGNTGSFRTRLNSTTFVLRSNTNIPANETRYFQVQIRDDAGTSSNALITSSGNASSVVNLLDTNLSPPTVELLLVAGGGGASPSNGGGAGGLLYYGANTTPKTPNGNVYQVGFGTYAITVGAGGAVSNRGSNSAISFGGSAVYTSLGGGTGADTGGSGGGGPGGSGTPGQGNPGGPSNGPSHPTGAQGYAGGGGAGGAGGNGAVGGLVPGGPFARGEGGAGGSGLFYSITGTDSAYAGGGGGSAAPGGNGALGGAGGSGVGGSGSGRFGGPGGAGTTNTGGGGGAMIGPNPAGAGGSGVVVLRYPDAKSAASGTTGDPNVIVSGGYRVYRYWQSGTITF